MQQLEELWEQYQPAVQKAVNKVLGRFDDYRLDRDDALQEARLCLWRCSKMYKGESNGHPISFGAYLRGALRLSLLSWVRRTLPHTWDDRRKFGGKQSWTVIYTCSLSDLEEDEERAA